jgi:hypothetical protein
MTKHGRTDRFLVLLATAAVPTLAMESSASAGSPTTPSEFSSSSKKPPKDFSQKYQLRVVTNEASPTVITGTVTNAEAKSFPGLFLERLEWSRSRVFAKDPAQDASGDVRIAAFELERAGPAPGTTQDERYAGGRY